MDAQQITEIRRFNRLITQRVGALEQSYLHRGRPLGEARVVFEVGAQGAHGLDVRALRGSLGLDSGYLSRLLRSLESQGLIEVCTQQDDARVRRVHLTRKGKAELAAYNALSDDVAASMLAPLEASQRARLIAAMAEVERLIRAAGVEISREDPGSTDVRLCLDAYFRELAARFETGFDPAQGKPVCDADVAPPLGCFVVARLEGVPVGCCALKHVDGEVGEIKRMWTAPSARGMGIAGRMLRVLEDAARELGLSRLRLDSNRVLAEAHALYRKHLYTEVPAFNDDPYAHHWFEKRL
ncbi:helix-turn-helix domain-containing GNAT family N-acetyltransferase [Xanthobacter sp. DSM 24535]|uniref:bifunctional helix-turn-helix transcriptional regulator/GNAT family N-acetyltransferase n=1 Tax=Roseixanthobacter psychrophilus TaxID=3119917 RepID=UPI00372930B4